MKLEIDFVPDLIVYYRLDITGDRHVVKHCWGDYPLFEATSLFIEGLIRGHKDCMIFIKKRSLKYRIYDVEWRE